MIYMYSLCDYQEGTDEVAEVYVLLYKGKCNAFCFFCQEVYEADVIYCQ